MKHRQTNIIIRICAAALAFMLSVAAPGNALVSYAASAAPTSYSQNTASAAGGIVSEYEGVQAADEVFKVLIPADQLYAVSGAFDPVFYASEYPDVTAVLGTDAAALQKHYETLGVYEGRKANADDTAALSSRVTRIITRFLLQNRDDYLAHAGEADFPYFNAAAYLAKYPALRTAIAEELAAGGILPATETNPSGLSETDYDLAVAKAATEHYLTYGALAGLSSGTNFDPVWAILAQPASYDYVNGSTPAAVESAYKAATGTDSTKNLPVGTDKVTNRQNQQAGILTLISKTTPETSATAVTVHEENTGSSGNSGNSGSSTPSTASQTITNYSPVNHWARSKIDGYRLYKDAESSGYQFVFNTAEDGQAFNGYFDADTYHSVREAAGTSQKYTVIVYMCGTDLEDNGDAAATLDIIRMLKSQYDIQNANVLILAGGTKTWSNSTMVQDGNNDMKACLYYLDPSALSDDAIAILNDSDTSADESEKDVFITNDTLKLLGSYDEVSMGDSELLLGVLDTAYDLFPADNYWLSLWNHGGGSASGICFPDMPSTGEDSKQLSLSRIEEALGSSEIYQYQGGFSILGMDACLMGGLETAYNMANYADYMIASEEVTYGAVPYDQYFKYFKGDDVPSAFTLATNGCQGYMDTHKSSGLVPSTQACYDLSKLQTCADAVNRFGYAMNNLLLNENTKDAAYRAYRDAAAETYFFAVTNGEKSPGEYVDLVDFTNKLRTRLQTEADRQEGDEKALYLEAINSIPDMQSTEIIAYFSAYFCDGNVADADGTEGSPIALDQVKNYPDSNYYNMHGGVLTGASLFVPFYTTGLKHKNDNLKYDKDTTESKDLIQYINESVFTGYAEFLKSYEEVANSETEMSRVADLNKALYESNYSDVISGMSVDTYKYTTSDNKEYCNYVVHLNFRDTPVENNGNTETAATAFMETVDTIAVDVTHQDKAFLYNTETEDYDEEATTVDIVIASSKNTAPSAFISAGTESDGLCIDTALLEMVYFYLTGSTIPDGDEASVKTFDYATSSTVDSSYYVNNPTLAKDKDSTISLEGRAYVKDENGEDTVVDHCDLLFTMDENENGYYYAGYLTYDEETMQYTEHTDAVGVDVKHYYVTADGNAILCLEDGEEDGNNKGKLQYAVEFDTSKTLQVEQYRISGNIATSNTSSINENNENGYAIVIQPTGSSEQYLYVPKEGEGSSIYKNKNYDNPAKSQIGTELVDSEDKTTGDDNTVENDNTDSTEDEDAQGGDPEGGDPEDDDPEGGDPEGGDTLGDDTEDDDTVSGESEGDGQEEGGSESGDSESGDSESGGSESGGSESGESEGGDSQGDGE